MEQKLRPNNITYSFYEREFGYYSAGLWTKPLFANTIGKKRSI